MADSISLRLSRVEGQRWPAIEWVLAHREIVALSALMAIAGGLRLWGLDVRAIHHDESLHTQYAWYLSEGRAFNHDPLMHGPFRFEATALVYFLFGDTDFSSRLLPALLGVALVGMPYFLKRQIGMTAVLIAAVLLTFSPSLLYVSRFIRDDMFISVWTLGLVILALRYLEEQRDGYLYGFAFLLAVSFATMEVTYITAAILLLYLNFVLAADLTASAGGSKPLVRLRGLLLAPIAWLMAACWPLLSGKPFGRERLPPAGDLVIVLGTLVLPQFAAAVQVLPFVGDSGYRAPAEADLTVFTVLGLILVSAYFGLLWRPKVWLACAAFFFMPYALLFTTFLTNQPAPWSGAFWDAGGGFWSGIWGSLDYWLAQHGVQRGSQPDYYYALTTPLYEFLPLVVTLAGGAWLLLRGGSLPRWLLFWALGTFVALSIAGEKMPWLTQHLALPLCLSAAVILARATEALRLEGGRWLTAAGQGLLAGAGVILLVEADGATAWLAAGWLLLAAAGLWALTSLRTGLDGLMRAGLAVAMAMLLALSVRTALQASFRTDRAEMIVYAQVSQDVAGLRERIDDLATRSGLGLNLPVMVDSSLTWPWAWYLRDYQNVTYANFGQQSVQVQEGAVLLVGSENSSAVSAAGYETVPHRHYLWFPQPYLDLSVSRAATTLTSGDGLRSLTHYFLYRWPDTRYQTSNGVAFFPDSLAVYDIPRQPQGPPAEPQQLADGRIVIGGSGKGFGQLQQPSDVFIDAGGDIWVADARNHRVQKFDSSGTFLFSFGGPGSPPGAFNEPWGVAVDADGFVYVSDTWNHRIQKFSPQGVYVTSWGRPGSSANPSPLELYGPRDIAIDAAGLIWVSDTGNKRLLSFKPDGSPASTLGSGGSGPGQFSEPVGIAFNQQGTLFVADTWNSRIQLFHSDFGAAVILPAPWWDSQDILAKPYIAVLRDSRIIASVPHRAALLLLSLSGTPIGAWCLEPGSLPLGVGARADSGFAYADGRQNKVEVVPAGLIDSLFDRTLTECSGR